MSNRKIEIFETVDADGNAIGRIYSTWVEAHVAALAMQLSVRRDTMILDDCDYSTVEPQEWTLETALPKGKM